MATPKSQRVGIWIIAVFMMVGALGTSLAMVLGNQNSMKDQTALQADYAKYQADQKVLDDEYSVKLAVQSKELSNKYYAEFASFVSRVSQFKSEGIKELVKTDLKEGDGPEVTKDTIYNAYYIGWNPRGSIFDQSIDSDSLKAPISNQFGLIKGWEDGVVGMKIGGIRELTIPSDKAYGSDGKGDDIPPNTPLKFIIMVIPKVDEIPKGSAPMSDLLSEYFKSQGQE